MELRRNGVDQFGTVRVVTGREPVKLIGLCFLILVFIAILYFNSLGNQFTNWDDGMIYQNPSIRNLNWEGIKKIFTLEKGNTFQPIRMLSYAIDYHFWKLNPLGYHITNIFLLYPHLHHGLLNPPATFRQFKRQSDTRFAPEGRLLWSPSLRSSSCPCGGSNLACRKERGSSRLFLLSCFLFLSEGKGEGGRKRILYFGVVLFSILLAVLSKPSAVVFPGVILLYEITRGKERLIRFLQKHWVSISLSLMCLRNLYLHFDEGDVRSRGHQTISRR